MENYRPISVLPTHSKVYEKCMYGQIHPYFEIIFPNGQCDFCQDCNIQHCLLKMLEKRKQFFDDAVAWIVIIVD